MSTTLTPAEQARKEFTALATLAGRIAAEHADTVVRLAGVYAAALRRGGTIFFAGNGGSAADAQHVAAEYVIRFTHDRRALAAVAITTDTSVITAGANDLGFDEIFARQTEALVRKGDLLVIHSTSGGSKNMIRAVEVAKAKGATTVGILGKDGGPVRAMVDDYIVIPSSETTHIQELHLAVEHVIVALVERELGI
jgi:D-sedoheptulose 7-phosphate isomerase